MANSPTESREAEILARVVRPEEHTLSEEAARSLLRLGFDARDRQRLHELLVKNQAGELAPDEEVELDSYRRVGRLLDLLGSKARRSLSLLGGGG